MSQPHSPLRSFTVVMVGMVLLMAGMAALGIWVAAAGGDAFGLALGGGIVMVIFLATGFTLLVLAYRRRGGLLKQRPTASEARTYREDYRS
jgi:hypothetical protein